MKKIVNILFIIIGISIMVSMPVFADSVGGYEFEVSTPSDTADATRLVGSILGTIQWIAIVAAVIIITILGIKYMFGSLEEKAQYKKSMLPLVIGIAVVVLATTITNIMFNLFDTTEPSVSSMTDEEIKQKYIEYDIKNKILEKLPEVIEKNDSSFDPDHDDALQYFNEKYIRAGNEHMGNFIVEEVISLIRKEDEVAASYLSEAFYNRENKLIDLKTFNLYNFE